MREVAPQGVHRCFPIPQRRWRADEVEIPNPPRVSSPARGYTVPYQVHVPGRRSGGWGLAASTQARIAQKFGCPVTFPVDRAPTRGQTYGEKTSCCCAAGVLGPQRGERGAVWAKRRLVGASWGQLAAQSAPPHLCHLTQQLLMFSMGCDFQIEVLGTTFGSTRRWDR